MKNFIVFGLLIIIFSCGNADKPAKPDNLLSKSKMEAILYDAYILNAAKASNKKKLEKHGVMPQNVLFEKYDIDSIQFAESSAYYAHDIETYQSIVAAVKDRISKEKEILDKQVKKEDEAKKKKQDSIKKAKAKIKDSLGKELEPLNAKTIKKKLQKKVN